MIVFGICISFCVLLGKNPVCTGSEERTIPVVNHWGQFSVGPNRFQHSSSSPCVAEDEEAFYKLLKT